MTVRDVMTTEVATVAPDTHFKEIARILVEREVSALPVVDDGRLVGLVSEADLLHKEEFHPENPTDEYHVSLRARLRRPLGTSGSARRKARAETAEGLMSAEPVTAGPGDSVVLAARAMDRFGVKRLPVVDERGRLLGIVSRRDLLRVFVRPDEDIARDAEAHLAAAPSWLAPERLRCTVHDGTLTVEGRLDQRSHCAVLLQLLHRIDGVVGVRSELTWDRDDMLPPRTPYAP